MLKVLNINDMDIRSRRFNGFDLAPFLERYGIKSSMCVWEKQSGMPYVDRLSPTIVSQLGPTRLQWIKHLPFTWVLPLRECFRKSDLLHLHLIQNGNFSIRALPLLTSFKPTVWTIHDTWILSQHKDSFKNCEFEGIVASEWMYSKLKDAPILNGKILHVVPFGINQADFHPKDQAEAKKALNLLPDRVVISFRTTNGKVKGLDIIKKALLRLDQKSKDRIQVIGFSEKGLIDILKGEFPVLDWGWADTWNLQTILNASDIVLMPSREESFGMVALEAMACGKPVIVKEGTALPELCPDLVFRARRNWPAESKNALIPFRNETLALRDMIDWLIWDEGQRKAVGKKNLAHVRNHHLIEDQAKKTAEIYHKVAG